MDPASSGKVWTGNIFHELWEKRQWEYFGLGSSSRLLIKILELKDLTLWMSIQHLGVEKAWLKEAKPKPTHLALTHLFVVLAFHFNIVKKQNPKPNRLEQVKHSTQKKTFTKVNRSNPELKLNRVDFQWSHQPCNTNRSVIYTLGKPSKKCAPRSVNLCYFDAILKACTSYFSDNVTFLRECVLCRG